MLSSLTLCVAHGQCVRDTVQAIHDQLDEARLEVCCRADRALTRLVRPDLMLLLLQPAGDTLSETELELLRVSAEYPVKVALVTSTPHASQLSAQSGGRVPFTLPGDEYRLRQFVAEAHARHFRGDDTGEESAADSPTPLLGSEWAELIKQLRRVARQDATVLLTGETGCGKTMLARRLHDESPRASRPFVVADCAAMSETLVASDLFGHVRGAYTGADRERTGKLAEVGGGTLVLEEVNSLPLSLQAKLLRAVEERTFEPVGSNTVQRFDGRIVAASNADLLKAVQKGDFRSDLYYRLNVIEFRIPPLRERVGAIIALAQLFLRDSRVAAMQGVSSITPAALQKLLHYSWPGNVRELRNAIERASSFASTAAIDVADLPSPIGGAGSHTRPPQDVPHEPPAVTCAAAAPQSEKERIVTVLRQHKNNRLAAARQLGISRNSLYKKLHRLGIYLPKRSEGEVTAVQPASR